MLFSSFVPTPSGLTSSEFWEACLWTNVSCAARVRHRRCYTGLSGGSTQRQHSQSQRPEHRSSRVQQLKKTITRTTFRGLGLFESKCWRMLPQIEHDHDHRTFQISELRAPTAKRSESETYWDNVAQKTIKWMLVTADDFDQYRMESGGEIFF